MLKATVLRTVISVFAVCALAQLVPSAASAAEVDEVRTASAISWAAGFEFDHAVVVVSGPFGVTSWTVAAGGPLAVDVTTLEKLSKARAQSLNGAYNYEILFSPRIDGPTRAALNAARAAAGGADTPELPIPEMPVVSGYFLVSDGAIVGAGENTVEGAATKDVLHYDDVIVTGSLCVGFDCVDGESFGYDTLRLKENNLQLAFDDTSTGSFPANDWRIVVNERTSGGASYLGVEDSTAGRMPFRIEAGAPADSLYVEDYGRIGLGTSVPVVELHIKDSDTPTTRLEQDSSGGWTAQTWDMAGNESNFFIRDVTNGSKLSFRIEPGTPSSTLSLRSTGNVGIGTWSPAAPLEVETTGENSVVLLDRTDGGQWYLSSKADGTFTIGTSAEEAGELLIIDNLGNLTTSGTVNGISDRDAKWDFSSVDSARILEAVSRLSITSWSLIGDLPGVRHLGPTAQDFHAAFGLGSDERHIALSDVGGVALAAIQALSARLEERDRQIEELQRRLEALEKRLQ